MEYLTGSVLALAVAALAAGVGFHRDRSFAPTILIVVASYYVLFALMGGSGRTLVIEIFAASGFLLLAVLGFKTNPWLIAATMLRHEVFDFLHHLVGPELAPGVAAATFVAISSFAPLAAFEQGGLVGSDSLAMLHKNEMVLPAPISQGLQAMIGGGSTDNSRQFVVNYHAAPGGNNDASMRRDVDQLVVLLKGKMRDGAFG